MKRRIHLFTCLLAGVLLVLAGCNSSGSSSDTLDEGEQVRVSLLQTSDVHHHASGTGASATYSPTDGKDSSDIDDFTKGGYGRIARKVFEIREDNGNQDIPTLLVDSGDFLMGTVYDMTLGSSPAAFKFMEDVQYDAITLGNHEFDYGVPGLAQVLKTAQGPGGSDFTIPIVATNMVPSDKSDADGIKAFIASGLIQDTLVKTLPNGLKVAIVGLLGSNAETDAPLLKDSETGEAILSFHNDMNVQEDIDFLQAKVDDLKKNQGVHLVVALSHSGVSKTDADAPEGDDIDLAKKVSGIDIIASGHEHKKTDAVIKVVNETDASHTTYIICPGQYGENLSQLDITYKQGTGVTAVALANHAINDSTPGDFNVDSLVAILDEGLNDALGEAGLPGVNDVIAESDSDNLAKPGVTDETGMGNLAADSLRFINYALTITDPKSPPPPSEYAIGVVPNGVIRNGFEDDQKISLADTYSVLPLGMTSAKDQEVTLPGYPLLKVYFTGEDIGKLCQIIAYVMASQDSTFVAGLEAAVKAGSADGATPEDIGKAELAGGLLAVFELVKPELFLNLSGVQFTVYKNQYYRAGDVKVYNPADFTCFGVLATEAGPVAVEPTAIEAGTPYPVIIDLYSISALLTLMNPATTKVPAANRIWPVTKDKDPVNPAELLDYRLDMNPVEDGIQEMKEWQAFYKFLTAYPGFTKADGEEYLVIPDTFYGKGVVDSAKARILIDLTPPAP